MLRNIVVMRRCDLLVKVVNRMKTDRYTTRADIVSCRDFQSR